MFSFFRKKAPPGPVAPAPPATADATPAEPAAAPAPAPAAPSAPTPPVPPVPPVPQDPPTAPQAPRPSGAAPGASASSAGAPGSPTPAAHVSTPVQAPIPAPTTAPPPDRAGWLSRLRQGLVRTGSGLTQVFTGVRIDDALYEELEAALLMADTGTRATTALLAELKRRVKDARANDPAAVKALLADAVTDWLAPLQRPLEIGAEQPTVIMVAGVNGAGKTTTIGKLTRRLADGDCKVLLAAADTFRAAAREQLGVWADRNRVEIVSQQGGDPAAVSYDAVMAGKARGCDVVIADTAGRLPTQLHLMDELKKIKRVIGKAQAGAPHEVLLVVDGNTGQNALAQVQAFDAALQLTGLVVTKLDGTAKGGVLAAIAAWQREAGRSVPVYFIGVGEQLEDLQPFDAREFAQALLG
jgi:fused signal recognition particle receptor